MVSPGLRVYPLSACQASATLNLHEHTPILYKFLFSDSAVELE